MLVTIQLLKQINLQFITFETVAKSFRFHMTDKINPIIDIREESFRCRRQIGACYHVAYSPSSLAETRNVVLRLKAFASSECVS